MRRILLASACVLFSGLHAAAHAQSTAGAQSLLITPGARADGMGRAYTALAEDPTSVWWNTGAMAFTEVRGATLMHTKLVPGLADDVYYEYLGYTQPLQGVGGLGFNIIYLTYGESEAVDDQEQSKGTFKSYEVAGTGSIGFQVTPKIGFGVALKYVYVSLAPAWATEDGRDGSGSSFAIDTGLLLKDNHLGLTSTDRLNLSLVVTNLGPDISFVDEGQSSPLGRTVKVGAMYEMFNSGMWGLRATFDYNQPIIASEKVNEDGTKEEASLIDQLTGEIEEPIQHFGGEIGYAANNIKFAGRLGYIHDPEGDIKDMTFGLGFGLGAVTVDWAMVPQASSLEDNVHKFSLTAVF